MKKLKISVLSVLMVMLYTIGIAQAVKYNVTDETTMTISGTSTLHDWTSTVNDVKGFVEVNEGFAKSGKIGEGDEINLVSIVVPVDSIISPRGATMDKKTYNALKSAEHPEIIFNLQKSKISDAKGELFTIDAEGDLTIAGVTKQVAFPVEGKIWNNGKMSFNGSYKLNMTEYDMEPPSAMFGQIVTGEEVEIKFELIVNK